MHRGVTGTLPPAVTDTWAWVQRDGPRGRPGVDPGLPVELVRALLSGRVTDREHLLSLSRDLAVVHGRVTLSSGREADYYLDLRSITLSGLAAPLVGRVMLELTDDLEYVGGLTMTALAACREVGASVVGVATIADRATGAADKIEAQGVPYRSAYSLAELGLA